VVLQKYIASCCRDQYDKLENVFDLLCQHQNSESAVGWRIIIRGVQEPFFNPVKVVGIAHVHKQVSPLQLNGFRIHWIHVIDDCREKLKPICFPSSPHKIIFLAIISDYARLICQQITVNILAIDYFA